MNLKKVILLVTPMILTLYFCAADIPIVTSELQTISSKVFRLFEYNDLNHLSANPTKWGNSHF